MMGVMQQADLYLAILLRKRRFFELINFTILKDKNSNQTFKNVYEKSLENLFAKY